MKILSLILCTLMILTLVSCQSTKTETSPITTTPIPVPEGSVLGKDSDWISSDTFTEGEITYTKLRITATVQNVGDEGTLWVYVEITEKDLVSQGKSINSTKVYMRKGEEKKLTFDFWAINSYFHYNIWCMLTPLSVTTTTTKPATTESDSWTTYSDSDWGYSIDYPTSWTFRIQQNPPSNFKYQVVFIEQGYTQVIITCNYRETPVYSTWSKALDYSLQENPNNCLIYAVLYRQKWYRTDVDEAILLTTLEQWQESYPLKKIRELFIRNSGYWYQIECTTNASEYDSYSSTFDRIIYSFKLIQ